MKTVCVLLSFSILLAGCYSQSSLTKEESAPNDEAVVFYLKDGRTIESKPEEHTRTNAGYQVVGELVEYEVGTFFTDVHAQGRFEGMIRDSDIQKVTANKIDAVATSISVVLGAAIVLLAAKAIIYAANPMHF